ncbi:hypothetical protein [Devosia ginsengisoli]|uniref:hypothetical protein n=1 Tax=Devosia ginsengisoli TaxID=400770 RepID=UPI0026F26D97|nr:hypothetical protein [Devosia ginsengisoli]MCR6671854.1 hypothetical protein [Devosia ginsengisoli]
MVSPLHGDAGRGAMPEHGQRRSEQGGPDEAEAEIEQGLADIQTAQPDRRGIVNQPGQRLVAGNGAKWFGEEPEGHEQAGQQGNQALQQPFQREDGHQPESQHAENGGAEEVDEEGQRTEGQEHHGVKQAGRRLHAIDQRHDYYGGNDGEQERVGRHAGFHRQQVKRVVDRLEQPDRDIAGIEGRADGSHDAVIARGAHDHATQQGIGDHVGDADAVDRGDTGIDGEPDGDAGKDLHQLAENIGPDLVAIGEAGEEAAAGKGGIGGHETAAAALRR